VLLFRIGNDLLFVANNDNGNALILKYNITFLTMRRTIRSLFYEKDKCMINLFNKYYQIEIYVF